MDLSCNPYSSNTSVNLILTIVCALIVGHTITPNSFALCDRVFAPKNLGWSPKKWSVLFGSLLWVHSYVPIKTLHLFGLHQKVFFGVNRPLTFLSSCENSLFSRWKAFPSREHAWCLVSGLVFLAC